MEYYSLESGLPGDPLSLPVVSYVTANTWISCTIQGMRKYDIEIRSGLSGLETWSEKDIFIMDCVSAYASESTLATINKVRMFLRVVTVSDLLSADGKTL